MRNVSTMRAFAKITALAALALCASPYSGAQTFQVLHSFTGADGAHPIAVPLLDGAGNLYGPTSSGTGGSSNGSIFKLSNHQSGWVLTSLYNFQGGSDGAIPRAAVRFGQNGALYGTTSQGGGSSNCDGGCGTVFMLQPPAAFCHSVSCPWQETQLYAFQNAGQGADPNSPLLFDAAGNILGTTGADGGAGLGFIYQLTPSMGSWTESILHAFVWNDGAYPNGLVSDAAGNLYGTTASDGPYDFGTVFELSPSESGWTYTVLYAFYGSTDGGLPNCRLVFDQSGNLYGTTTYGGWNGSGTVFELFQQNGSWVYTVIYDFVPGPVYPATLTVDSAGNLYGTTYGDGGGYGGSGSVYKMTRSGSSWTFATLYSFTGGSDGAYPVDAVAIDASGNLYGVAYNGGSNNCQDGCGTVWKLTP